MFVLIKLSFEGQESLYILPVEKLFRGQMMSDEAVLAHFFSETKSP